MTNYFIDRNSIIHTTPDCEEFARHPEGNPNNDMPAFNIPPRAIQCADCD